MITLGKNKITNILNNKKKILGSNNYYNYYYYRFDKKIDINFKSENIFIYILECKNQKQTLRVKNNLINLRENDLIKVKKKKIDTISIYATDSITLLIVYSSKTSKKEKKITIQKIKNFYTVNKPWGYEQWLTGANNKNFAFKKIFLKKGTKTSLQYHVKKIETNFLFDGRAKLHFMIKNIYLLKKNFKKILISVKCKKSVKVL